MSVTVTLASMATLLRENKSCRYRGATGVPTEVWSNNYEIFTAVTICGANTADVMVLEDIQLSSNKIVV